MEQLSIMEMLQEVKHLLGAYWLTTDYLIDFATQRFNRLVLRRDMRKILTLIKENANLSYSTEEIITCSFEDFFNN